LDDDGDDEQPRVGSETVLFVILALCLTQGVQIRHRFLQEHSTDTASEGGCTDECLFGIAHRGIVYAKVAGFSGLHTFTVYTTISHHTLTCPQLARSILGFVFFKFWEGSDEICEEEPDAQGGYKTAVGTFGGQLDFVALELSGMFHF
jgi:hypothetical protein